MPKVRIRTMTVLNFYVQNNTALKYLKQNDIECQEILGRKLRKQCSRGRFHISFLVFD